MDDVRDDVAPSSRQQVVRNWASDRARPWAAMASAGDIDSVAVVDVPFSGRSATAPLTWGQEHVVTVAKALKPWPGLNLVVAIPLPPGLDVDDVAHALTALVTTFESLQTLYTFTAAQSEQVLLGGGVLEMAVLRTSRGHVDVVSGSVEAHMRATSPFDYSHEWPVRAVLVCDDATPAQLVLSLSHAVVEAPSVHNIVAFFARQLDVAAAPPPPTRTPMEQASRETSVAGRRQAERSLRYAEKVLTRMPCTTLPRALVPNEGPRFRHLTLTSRAAALASDALCRDYAVSPTSVVLAALATVVAHTNGLEASYLQLLSSNRFETATREAVGVFTQDVVALLDARGATFEELCRRTGRSLLSALRHGSYPPAEMAALRRSVEERRGMALDVACCLNDRRLRRPAPSGPAVTRDALAVVREKTSWTSPVGVDRSTSTYFLSAGDGPEGELCLDVVYDSFLIPDAEMLGWLAAVERILCDAATGVVDLDELCALASLTPPQRGNEWALVEGSWIDVEAVARLVRTVSGDSDATVVAVETGAGVRLRAELPGRAADDVAALRRDCLRHARSDRTVMVPHDILPGLEATRQPSVDAGARVDAGLGLR